MPQTTEELKKLSDTVWERTRRRLDGLTEEEYRWEPAPGCWSIRERRDGTSFHEWAPIVYPDPFTTLAWRLWHLIDLYGEDRAPQWLDVPPQGEAVGLDAPDPTPPATAAGALDQLDRAHARRRAPPTTSPCSWNEGPNSRLPWAAGSMAASGGSSTFRSPATKRL